MAEPEDAGIDWHMSGMLMWSVEHGYSDLEMTRRDKVYNHSKTLCEVTNPS